MDQYNKDKDSMSRLKYICQSDLDLITLAPELDLDMVSMSSYSKADTETTEKRAVKIAKRNVRDLD